MRLTQWQDLFDVSEGAFLVQPGKRSSIHVSYEYLTLTKDAEREGIKERGCRLAAETHSKNRFPHYTRRACIYECVMEKAKELYGCVPWHYAHTEVKPRVLLFCEANDIFTG